MQRRAVAVESHVDVGTMLQVVPKQVHLPVARRRVERHGAYLDPRHTSRVTSFIRKPCQKMTGFGKSKVERREGGGGAEPQERRSTSPQRAPS